MITVFRVLLKASVVSYEVTASRLCRSVGDFWAKHCQSILFYRAFVRANAAILGILSLQITPLKSGVHVPVNVLGIRLQKC